MTVRSATATFAIATVAAILTAGQAAAQSPGTLPAPSFGTSPAQSPADAVRGFSIVLVEGSLQPAASSDLPAPAKAALEDIKDFLPFKSFRLLDASWMVGAMDVRSRLSGGDRDYDVAVAVTRQAEGKDLAIRFTLRDVSSRSAAAAQADQNALARGTTEMQHRLDTQNQRQRLQAALVALEAMRQRLDQKHPDVQRAEEAITRDRERLLVLERAEADNLRRTVSELARGMARPADPALIDTSFSMRVGETVVVGTSRVNGERALIALMTAVSKEPVVVRRPF